ITTCYAFFLVITFAALLTSCKKNSSVAINYQYDYYPLDSGHYIIYHVDSILYSFANPFYTSDTVSYDWKVQMGGIYYDNLGRPNHTLECFRRQDSTHSWNLDRLWYAFRATTNLQVI